MVRTGAPAGPPRLALRRWVPYLLLAVTALLSVYAAFYVSSSAEARRRSEFLAAAAETRTQIEVRLDTYIEVVRAGAALLGASNEIHQSDFRAFVRALELGERYPGIDGIGFTQYVAAEDLPALSRSLALDGGRPLHVEPAGPRPAYQPVMFVEPAPEGGVVGFDLLTDPSQREAMDRARDTGRPALSARVSEQAAVAALPAGSVVLYEPVYRTGAPTATVDERRRALHGFVFGAIRPDVLLSRVAATAGRDVTFEVYDGPESGATLLHASARPEGTSAHESSGPLSVGGRLWLVVLRSPPQETGFLPAAQNALTIGLVLSVMLFAITFVQIRAWETAKRQESELRASEQALRVREAQLRELVAREQAARAKAQEADRAKDDFLVGVSHELRTPISAMIGWLSMLKNGTVTDERRAHALDVVERNALLQARLIDDLLDVSRILLGKLSVNLQPLVLESVVPAVLDSLRPSAAAKGVELRADLQDGSGVIRGDAARVHQVVWNLMSNAIKFTPSGGTVNVELSGDEGWVELRVRDTGVGIPPEFLPHVFERFRQEEGARTGPHDGLGLGLAITRHLVQLHGGTVAAHSAGPGTGALFIVRFPAAPQERDSDRVGPARALGDGSAAHSSAPA